MAVSKKYEATPDDIAFMDYADKLDPQQAEIPWYKSTVNAAVRGLAEGGAELLNLAENASFTLGQALSEEPYEEKQKFIQPSSLIPEKGERVKYYKQNLPMEQSPLYEGIERGARLLPGVALGGGGVPAILGRTALSAAAGQGVKELGGSETAQNISELIGGGLPNLSKKIPAATAKQAQLLDFGRKMGMTEAELSLTLGKRGGASDFVQSIASKGGKTARAFDNTKAALGRVWDTLKTSPEAKQQLAGKESSLLINDLSKKLSRLPDIQREMIKKDFQELIGSKMTGDDIINFWQDLNYYIRKGEGGLGVLKDDLQKALNTISPQFGKDFEMTNQLYKNFSQLAEKMSPDIAESLLNAGEKGLMVSAITTGNYPLMQKLIGPLGARKLAAEMVTNPRLQNISERWLNAVERNIPTAVKKTYDQLVIEIGKNNAEAAAMMSAMDMEDFLNALDQENKKK